MKKLFALFLAMMMVFSLVACGGSDSSADTSDDTGVEESVGADTQPAIDAFNAAADAFDAVANAVNEDIDAYSQELIDTLNEMSDAMLEAKELLESDTEIPAETVEELVSNLTDIEAWAIDVYENLDTMTIEATTVDTSREAVVESFNYVSTRFDAISQEVNANIEAYDEEFVDGMVSIAEGLIAYKELLESGVELTEEESLAILEDLLLIDEWIVSVEG